MPIRMIYEPPENREERIEEYRRALAQQLNIPPENMQTIQYNPVTSIPNYLWLSFDGDIFSSEEFFVKDKRYLVVPTEEGLLVVEK